MSAISRSLSLCSSSRGPATLYLAPDPVDPTFARLALLAVGGVYPVLREPHRHRLERPALAVGVHAQRHRGAPSQSHEQVVVGVGPGVGAAETLWFVGYKLVPAGLHLGAQPLPRPHYHARLFRIRHLRLLLVLISRRRHSIYPRPAIRLVG